MQTTQIYLPGELALKERAPGQDRTAKTAPGRYRPPDKLIAFLERL